LPEQLSDTSGTGRSAGARSPLLSVADVILRDGGTLRLRPPGSEDADALLDFFNGLSERSFYLRFHGAPTVRPSLVGPFLDPDWMEQGALVGTLAGGDGERTVALASYARLRDPTTAEVAFSVADDQQGRGIGTRMLEQLAERAAAAGIERFVAEVMGDNAAMMRVFEDAGFGVSRALDRGTFEVSFPIEATDAYRGHVEERDHLAVVASLRPFFAPESVAVIGASTRREAIGGIVFRNILAAALRLADAGVDRFHAGPAEQPVFRDLGCGVHFVQRKIAAGMHIEQAVIGLDAGEELDACAIFRIGEADAGQQP